MVHNLDEPLAKQLLKILWEESITGLAIVKEDGTFWMVNPTFCRITEYTEYELKKLRFQDITTPKDVDADEEMARLTAKGHYRGYDINKGYITKTNRIQPVFLRVTGLKVDGQFMYFVGEVAPLDKRDTECRTDGKIKANAERNLFFKRVKENLPVILAVLGGLGILIGYATGLLQKLP